MRQSSAHAWAEYWQRGVGWVRADPTAAVAPERIVRSRNLRRARPRRRRDRRGRTRRCSAQLRSGWEALNNRWNQWVLNYSRGQQLDVLKDLGFDVAELGRPRAAARSARCSTLALAGAAGPGGTGTASTRGCASARRCVRARRALGSARSRTSRRALAGARVRARFGTRRRAARRAARRARAAALWPPRRAARPDPSLTRALRRSGAPSASRSDRALMSADHRHAAAPCRALLALAGRVLAIAALRAAYRARAAQARCSRRADAVTTASARTCMRFAADVAERHGLDPDWARQRARRRRAILPSGRPLHHAAAGRHGEELGALPQPLRRADAHPRRRLRSGATNETLAARSPRSATACRRTIVVGIVGVETIYGQQTGQLPRASTRSRRWLRLPERAAATAAPFFRDELENLFVLCQREGARPARAQGQLRRRDRHAAVHAVEHPQRYGDRLRRATATSTCTDSPADVIGSVAHYLAQFGLGARPGDAASVSPPPVEHARARASMLAPDIVPSFTPREFIERAARRCPMRRSQSTASSR